MLVMSFSVKGLFLVMAAMAIFCGDGSGESDGLIGVMIVTVVVIVMV